MTKFYTKLRSKLENQISKQYLDLLPRSYNILGKILLIKLDKRLIKYKSKIGREILKILPYVKTVCLIKSIKGLKRIQDIDIIAGERNTKTIHNEFGCQFYIDVANLMWSKGNKEEKKRLLEQTKTGETIVDMFSGLGYFSIILAKKAKKVYSIDINPIALKYLRHNSFLNKVENKIEILEGDCRDYADLLKNQADRIVMGHLYDTEQFLPAALKIAKKGAIIHFHRNVKEGDEIKFPKQVKVLRKRKIKSYAPKVWHMVYDLKKV